MSRLRPAERLLQKVRYVQDMPERAISEGGNSWRDKIKLVRRGDTDMGMTDPVADMLTRIRNACIAKKDKVEVPSSGLKAQIARVLKDEGYIENYKVVKDNKQGVLTIGLKYDGSRNSVIEGIQRVSRPGSRVFSGSDNLPKVIGGYGVAIISTSKGLLTDREARKAKVGGEVLCKVW